MALLPCSWLGWVASLIVCFLVLPIVPHGAYGSSRNPLTRKTSSSISNLSAGLGVCASAVTIHGYKCEESYVTTEDGYVLNLQRIPEGRTGNQNGETGTKRQPVIVQHGVIVDGKSWFSNSPEQNLPMVLADNGFDVWIANTRGTRFSRTHTTLQPSQRAFWDWTWDELVAYDLPAVFDHVYKETGQKTHYVGHSLGTLIILASLSEGRLIDQLQSAALLSPIAYLSHMTTALGNLAARVLLGEVVELLGVAEFDPLGAPVSTLVKVLCACPGIHCYDLLTAITGKNCCLNSSTVEVVLKDEPQPTSTKNMIHLAQTVRSGAVAKFNYERNDINVMHYGDIHPPVYNFSNIPKDIPLFLSYGGADALSDARDVTRLLDDLQLHDRNKLAVQLVDNYGHTDFVMAVNANDVVYNSVVSFFKLHRDN